VAAEQAAAPTVIGVEAAASPVFTTAIAHGRLVTVQVLPTLADGLAGNAEAGSITFDLIRDLRLNVIAVDEHSIEAAMRGLLAHERQTIEGAGAVGVAALLAGASVQGKRVAVILSGGNVDAGRLSQEQPDSEREQHQRKSAP
jgi:threonine dehydratase